MMTKRPVSVTATFILLLFNALIWMAFGILVALGLHPAIPENAIVRWAMASLAIVCATALAGLVVLLARRNKIAYYFAAVLLSVIAVLTITDEFGYSDLAVLLVTIVTLILLAINRRWYFYLS